MFVESRTAKKEKYKRVSTGLIVLQSGKLRMCYAVFFFEFGVLPAAFFIPDLHFMTAVYIAHIPATSISGCFVMFRRIEWIKTPCDPFHVGIVNIASGKIRGSYDDDLRPCDIEFHKM